MTQTTRLSGEDLVAIFSPLIPKALVETRYCLTFDFDNQRIILTEAIQ